MDRQKFISFLERLGACRESLMFVRTSDLTPEQMWKDCTQRAWLGWLVGVLFHDTLSLRLFLCNLAEQIIPADHPKALELKEELWYVRALVREEDYVENAFNLGRAYQRLVTLQGGFAYTDPVCLAPAILRYATSRYPGRNELHDALDFAVDAFAVDAKVMPLQNADLSEESARKALNEAIATENKAICDFLRQHFSWEQIEQALIKKFPEKREEDRQQAG